MSRGGKRTAKNACLAALLLLACSVPAYPESDAPPSPLPDENAILFQEIPSVFGASKHDQKVTEAPSSVTIVTAAEIRAYGYRTLADILRSVRGFFVTYDRNYEFAGVRGFARPGDYNTRILLLVDGHRVNDGVYDQAYIGTDFILDVDLIDRVEVIPGPSSSLYGSNAFFGVINVITRQARDLKGFEASGEAGSAGTYKGRLSYGNRFGNGLGVVFSGTRFRSEGRNLFFKEFDDPATNNGVAEKRDGDAFRSLFSTLSWGDVTLQAAYVNRRKDVPTGSFGTAFNDPGSRTTDRAYYADLKYARALDERTTFLGRVTYDWYGYRGDYAYVDNSVNPVPPFRYLSKDKTVSEWWGGEVTLARRLFRRHKVTAGAEYRDYVRQFQENVNDEPFAQVLDDHRRTRVYAFYLQDEIRIRDDLILNAGLRFDHYTTFGGSSNPRIALIYNPLAKTTLKLLYGEAFRAPTAYELYYNDGGVTQKANPDLKPETIRTYEAVMEQYVGDRLRLSASGYYYRIKDLISQQTDPADGLVVFRNVDEIDARGLELEIEGKWESGLEGRGSYAWQKTRDGATGRETTNSPRHTAKLNAIVPVVPDRLLSGLEVQFMSGRRTLAGNTAAGHTVANLSLLAPGVLKGLDLSASAYNLFDERFGDPGGEEHVQDLIPQDGRNYRLKLVYRF